MELLLIDSIEETLLVSQAILEPAFNVHIADSAEAALKLLDPKLAAHGKPLQPDIVLINSIMVNDTGAKVLQTINEQIDSNFIAMLMTSAKDVYYAVDSVLHGFDGFIRMPIELGAFFEQLEKAKIIHEMRLHSVQYQKLKATKAMSVTFSHYTRNLLTPLLGYLPKIKNDIPPEIYKIFSTNLNKINKVTFQIDELTQNGNFKEFSYADKTEFYTLKLDDD